MGGGLGLLPGMLPLKLSLTSVCVISPQALTLLRHEPTVVRAGSGVYTLTCTLSIVVYTLHVSFSCTELHPLALVCNFSLADVTM